MPRIQSLIPVLLLLLALLPVQPTFAQTVTEEQEHQSHHPAATLTATASDDETAPRGGMGGMKKAAGADKKGGMGGGMGGGGMKEMMKAMARPKSTELFPTLIKLPELTSEQRFAMQNQARLRVEEGVALLQKGFGDFNQALGRDDAAGLQGSAAVIEEGLSRFRSGLAVESALAAGVAPRRTALQWYKSQLNLLPPAVMSSGFRLFGMSPFSLFVCLFSAAIGLALLVTYIFKVRRTSTLLARLTNTEASSKGPGVPSPQFARQTPAKPQAATESPADPDESAAGCCSVSSASPLPGEGLLAKESRKLCRLRVMRIYQETPEVKTFRMVSCDGSSIPFSYQPGQFLTIVIPHEGKTIKRNYTISSSPTQGYYCEITVKREEQGIGSRYLHDVVQEGDTLEVRPPSGRFIFTGKESDSIVLIGGGVGVTPMMSIARAMLDMGWAGDLYFIYACRTLEDFIFADEMAILKRRNPKLLTFIVVGELTEERDGFYPGMLSGERLAEWVPKIASRRIHLCGSPPMMDAIRKMLAELGVPQEQVKFEMFGPPASASTPKDVSAAEDVSAAAGATISFSLSVQAGQLRPEETVLAAAERLGVEIDSSCQAGSCGMCVVKLLEGQVEMACEDGLSPEDKAQGMILACQAKARTDLVIEA